MYLTCIIVYPIYANGLDERFNQTIQNMLTKFVEEKETWDEYIDTCAFALNHGMS